MIHPTLLPDDHSHEPCTLDYNENVENGDEKKELLSNQSLPTVN